LPSVGIPHLRKTIAGAQPRLSLPRSELATPLSLARSAAATTSRAPAASDRPPPRSRAASVWCLELGPPRSTASGCPGRVGPSPPVVSVRRPGRLAPPRAWAAASSSYGHCLVELGSSSPSATAPALPAAPSTSASPTVKSHRSVALAARPDCRSCAAACCRPPVLPSAFTGRRPAELLLAGRPEVCCCR
jgi:hypothetical protein